MGQINTNNYPTVSSLADADLLIVENAVHGTGTTTPKQLRENAIGTDVLKTTAQTVTGAINELWTIGGKALCGSGKAVSVTNDVVDTDIDLRRAPKIGDRILVLFDSSVSDVDAIKTYNGSTAIQTSWESVPVLDFHLNGVCLIEFVADSLSPDPAAICARLVRMFEGTQYTAGTGININNGTIVNTKPQMGVNIDGGAINSVSSGNLGSYAKEAKYLVMTFNCNATAYNGTYYLLLAASSGTAVMYEAILVDPVTGGRYTKDIKKYTTLVCEVTNSGAGTSADPVLVNVIGEITNDLADKVDAVIDAISEEKTATGNPITLTDALALPAKTLSVNLEPIQDLHGYDKPWVGGGGKNKLEQILADLKTGNTDGTWTGNVYAINGGTVEVLTDNANNVLGMKANGTFTDTTIFYINVTSKIPAGGYLLSGCPSGGGGSTYKLDLPNASFVTDTGSGVYFTADGTTKYSARIVIYAGAVDNKVFQPMVRLSTVTDGTYAPYSNICPISGRTESTVTVSDGDETSANFTIQLGQTVYGGSVDFTTGTATVTDAIVDLGSLTYSKDTTTRPADGATINAFYATLSGAKKYGNTEVADIKCSQYVTAAVRDVDYGGYDSIKDAIIGGADANSRIWIYDSQYASYTGEAFKTAMSGVQLCYKLATPLELTLTPTEVQMLKGYNRVSAEGNIALTYLANRLDALLAS